MRCHPERSEGAEGGLRVTTSRLDLGMLRTIRRAFVGLVFLVPPLLAQQADSGMVHLTVEEPMGPVEGVLIRAAGRSTTTDGSGNARLTLPTGRQ